MKALKVAIDTFDQENTFTFAEFKYGNTCSLHKDYKKRGDGIFWAMMHSACLKDVYTAEDERERVRLSSGESTIRNGEIVLIEGKQHKVRFLGKYSDCAIFDPVLLGVE